MKTVKLWFALALAGITLIFGMGMSWAFLKSTVGRNTMELVEVKEDIESLKKIRIDIAEIRGNVERIDEKLDLLMRFAVIKEQ